MPTCFLDVARRAGISGVINFRLEQVITPKRTFRFRSSLPRVYVDYYFHVAVMLRVRFRFVCFVNL
jgi:hypothetical protein